MDVNELKQQIKNRFVQAKTCKMKQITQISRRQCDGIVGSPKMVQGRKIKGGTGELTGSLASDKEARVRSTGANL